MTFADNALNVARGAGSGVDSSSFTGTVATKFANAAIFIISLAASH